MQETQRVLGAGTRDRAAETTRLILTERETAAFGYATTLHAPKPRQDTNTSYARIFSQPRFWIWRLVVTKI